MVVKKKWESGVRPSLLLPSYSCCVYQITTPNTHPRSFPVCAWGGSLSISRVSMTVPSNPMSRANSVHFSWKLSLRRAISLCRWHGW
jgi:hypothetical protein